jgi:PEGA domain-containing protein
MRTIVMRFVAELLLSSSSIHPPAALLQSPGFGRLVIQSSPTGATISINGTQKQEQTNTTYVVGPGDYSVSVSGSASCGGQSFHVDSGGTTTIICKDGKWTQQ